MGLAPLALPTLAMAELEEPVVAVMEEGSKEGATKPKAGEGRG